MQFDLANSIDILQRTPSVLHALLGDLSTDWTASNEGPDTWSPFDVVGHLIDGEETDWMVRARIILNQEGDCRFEPYDRFRHLERNQGRDLPELLTELTALREQNVAELRFWNLAPDQLQRTGIHPEFGPVTLEQLLATWVGHDFTHIAQIVRVMAKQYKDAVGPWAKYLSVLHR